MHEEYNDESFVEESFEKEEEEEEFKEKEQEKDDEDSLKYNNNESFLSTNSAASIPHNASSSSPLGSPSHHALVSSKLPSLPSFPTSTLILPPGVTYYAKFNEQLCTFEVLQKNIFNIMKTINLKLTKASEQDLKYYLLSQISFIHTKNKQLSSSFKQLFTSSIDLNSCLNNLYGKINNNYIYNNIKKKKYMLLLKSYLINKKFYITKMFNNIKKIFYNNIRKLKEYNKIIINNYKQNLDEKERQLQGKKFIIYIYLSNT